MASRIFTTKVTQAKFTLSPFSSQQMSDIGQVMVDAKLSRIRRGINSDDAAAKELQQNYARRKLRFNRAPIRDWTWSGQMLGSFKVKSANQNRVIIGFVNDRADFKATVNRRREEMLSDSPRDTEALRAVLKQVFATKKVIRLIKSA